MITTTTSFDVRVTGAPLFGPAAACAAAPWAAFAAAPALKGHVSVQDVTPAKRDRIGTTDVFTAVPGLPAWSPPT